jgi:acetyl esterase/lipase
MVNHIFDIDSRLDQDLAEVRERFPSLGFDLRDLAGSRTILKKLAERARIRDTSSIAVEEFAITHPEDSTTLNLKSFRPLTGSTEKPALLWIHGGGYVMGSAGDTDQTLAHIALETDCTVFSVDYRLAPEHAYPAALDDCFDCLLWLQKHANQLKIDPERIAIGGASAGAGLTAALALRARDEGTQQVLFQLLIYPMLDHRHRTPSSRAIQDPNLWNEQTNRLAWALYLGALTDHDEIPLYASASLAADLTNLPPAFVCVGDLDIFLDEDIDYAQRLLQAGVPTELHVYPGAIHGFDMLAPDAAISQRLRTDVNNALQKAFDVAVSI